MKRMMLRLVFLSFFCIIFCQMQAGVIKKDTVVTKTSDIDEVIVIGYGSQKKKDLTGSTSSIKGSDLATNSKTSIGSALQGKLPGVSVLSTSGKPGAKADINIRGINTFGSGDNSPLVVIDDIPVDNGFETLNPSDIEQVTVLKDAATASIYGSRAANGVIVITTKNGRSGKGKFNISGQYGWQKASHIMDVLTAQEFVAAILEMRDNKKAIDGGNPTTKYDGLDPASFGVGTKWSDYIYKVAPTYNIAANVGGSSGSTTYYVSAEYLNQKGIGINTSFNKASFRSNLNSKVSKKLTLSNNTHIAYQNIKGDNSNRLSDVIFNAPVIPAYSNDGTYGEAPPQTSSKNAIHEVAWRTPSEQTYRLLDNISVQYQFLDHFKFKFNGGLDMSFGELQLFSPIYNDGGQTNAQNSLEQTRNKKMMWVTDYLLYYDRRLGEHTINAMIGFSRQLYQNDNIFGKRYDYVSESENMQVFNGSTNTTNISLSGGKNQLALSSYLGRLNYDYKGKYLASFNLRIDGSSRFKDSGQWGVFPSTALAWRISAEEFFKSNIINDLKIRSSWGHLGNQSIGSWYPTLASMSKLGAIFGTGTEQQLLYGYSLTSLGNKNLRWETTNILNFGLDATLFDNKFSITTDYFIKNTDGILRTMILPSSVGLAAPNVNYASVLNRGLEINMSYKNKINDFNYNISANTSFIHNEITKLSEGADAEILTAPYGGLRINKIGNPIDALYGYKTNGLITTAEEAALYKKMGQGNAKIGRYKYVDTNNDGLINTDDRVILGSHIPKATMGLSIDASYKGFYFNTNFIGVFSRKQHSPMSFQNRFPNRNISRHWYDNRWKLGENPEGKYPLMIQAENYEEMTDLMVANTSFAKWKMATLGYNFSLKNGDIKTKVYVTGENLLTITSKSFDGFDPENGNSYGHYTNWGGDYPTSRIIMTGIEFTS